MNGRPFWLWLNLLSLDAPVVALVWQGFLARCYPSALHPSARFVLGLTVWAIYLADRLIDVHSPATSAESVRHGFHRQHSGTAKFLLAVVLLVDLSVALLWLRRAILRSGLLTAAAIVPYFAIFVFRRKDNSSGKSPSHPWKQAAAAPLFTAGVFLVAWTRTPKPWHTLGPPAIVFCALCFSNLLLIERWEQNITTTHVWLWLILFALLCVFLGNVLWNQRWYEAVAASSTGLALLDLSGGLLSRDARRVLADAVLLTPLVFR